MQRIQDIYSAYYLVSDKEQRQLTTALEKNMDSDLTLFIVILLRELDNNLPRVLRLLNLKTEKTRLFNLAIYRKLILIIREVIIISNYENFIDSDGFISILDMTRSSRFELAGIDRATITRTFNKYNILYNKRK